MNTRTPKTVLVEAKNLTKNFEVYPKVLRAVDNVNLRIHQGETVGLVGESGSGKSTIGKLLLGLYKPTSGSVSYNQQQIHNLNKVDQKTLRQKIQIIFQDPFSSLNPHLTIEKIVKEPLIIHNLNQNGRERVVDLLEMVGLSDDCLNRYPHEFSGGQRQRIAIARALAVNPEFLICDEPISALDVSIQAQVINLLKDLQKKFNLTYLFISHDLAMVDYLAQEVAVLYLGNIVEFAPRKRIFEQAKHPYTQALIASIPHLDDSKNEKPKFIVQGEIPSPLNPPTGCAFHPRCPFSMPKCRTEKPIPQEIAPGHHVACHL